MARMKKVDSKELSKVTGGSRGVGGPGGMLDTAGTWKDLTGQERAALQQAKPKGQDLAAAIKAFHGA
ncbi:MAG TPA: hypothetical protein VNM14_03620 [Planctomycetota bacterium]|nr:hypothetical protein [Planctomycetota bacterium]